MEERSQNPEYLVLYRMRNMLSGFCREEMDGPTQEPLGDIISQAMKDIGTINYNVPDPLTLERIVSVSVSEIDDVCFARILGGLDEAHAPFVHFYDEDGMDDAGNVDDAHVALCMKSGSVTFVWDGGNNTYPNIADNGSPDGKPIVVKEWEKQNNRIA